MRAEDSQIAKSLDNLIRALWHTLHEYRRKFRDTGEQTYQHIANDIRRDLRRLFEIRRGAWS